MNPNTQTQVTQTLTGMPPVVGVVMGSSSDWDVMQHAVHVLKQFGGAGGAAHLPGMLAAKTTVPVLGVPVPSRHLHGQDSLLSIVQMPRGIPVATFAIGESGAVNAALFAVAQLALSDPDLATALNAYRRSQTKAARQMELPR